MSMLSLKEAAKMLDDALVIGNAETCFDRVCIDSRKVRAGDLFVALRGERFDAHHFLADVIEKQVNAVMVERDIPDCTVPMIQVSNTRYALAQLAKGWRQRFVLPVVAVTGSNGKTTVKEMIAAIFSAAVGAHYCLSTSGNLNNEIGVPLSVLRLNQQHQLAVFEIGMNHPGETETLAKVICPNIALINNAQREHQEFMLTIEAVALEHASVIHSLSKKGVAIFPATDAYQGIWRVAATDLEMIDFALWDDGQQTPAAVTGIMEGQRLLVKTPKGKMDIRLNVLGRHNGHNALAAIAVALAANISLDVIEQALEQFEAVSGRMQQKIAQFAHLSGATVIDDSYNANPDSVRAAIDVLAHYPQTKVLILGEMGEVGENSADFHDEVGAYAHQQGIDLVLSVGHQAVRVAQAFGKLGEHFETVDALIKRLQQLPLNANAIFLVKGSRFMKMEQIVSFLTASQQSIILDSEKH